MDTYWQKVAVLVLYVTCIITINLEFYVKSGTNCGKLERAAFYALEGFQTLVNLLVLCLLVLESLWPLRVDTSVLRLLFPRGSCTRHFINILHCVPLAVLIASDIVTAVKADERFTLTVFWDLFAYTALLLFWRRAGRRDSFFNITKNELRPFPLLIVHTVFSVSTVVGYSLIAWTCNLASGDVIQFGPELLVLGQIWTLIEAAAGKPEDEQPEKELPGPGSPAKA